MAKNNIQKRGDNSWFFTVYTGRDAKGKYGRKTKTITITDEALLKTKKRLQDYIDDEYSKFRQEVETGEYITPEKMTFASFVEEWKEKYAAKHLGQATLEIYMIHLNNRIIPVFGHKRLDSIKTFDIVSFIDSLKDAKRQDGKDGNISAGTIQYIHRAIKNVFNCAVEWNLIKTNPVAGVKKPKVERKDMEVYTQEEAAQLFTVLRNEPYHWRMLITLALTTGLRRGELLGLEWKHIDFEQNFLHVKQSLGTSKANRYMITEPKTKSSIRKVSLPESIMSELKEYKLHCNKERLKAADLWEGGERFFLFTIWNGKPISPISVNHYWTALNKRTGLKYIRFHDLRHTSATILLNQGVHAKIISARLGHADITTTLNIYAHALQEADQAAADKFESLFTPKIQPK